MKTGTIYCVFQKAPYPAVISAISLGLFGIVYGLDLLTAMEPHYFSGLIFAVPFACFAVVTYLTYKEELKELSSLIITSVLIGILSWAMFLAFIGSVFDAAMTITTDDTKYERALRLSSFSYALLENSFPEKIPDDAQDVYFSYQPAFLQGGENLALKFKTDADTIDHYIEEFSEKAEWIGKNRDSQASQHGVFTGTLDIFNYAASGLPYDLTIYVLMSRPYQPGDWNHGVLSLVAISEKADEILFLASRW